MPVTSVIQQAASSFTLTHLLHASSFLHFLSPNILTLYVWRHHSVNKGCVFLSHVSVFVQPLLSAVLVDVPPQALLPQSLSLVGISWHRSVSVGIGWYQLVSVGINWYRLVSAGIGWHQLVSIGISWYRLASVGIGCHVVWIPSTTAVRRHWTLHCVHVSVGWFVWFGLVFVFGFWFCFILILFWFGFL